MKIFGFEIGKQKPQAVQDQIPEVKTVIPDTKRPALVRPVSNPALNYHSSKYAGRGAFRPAEYNLAEVGRIEDTDSYARQSFDKKVALMFKEGWNVIGPNARVIKYIQTRFAQMARASGTPTDQLFRQVGSSLIRKSNAFLIKVRKTEASGGSVRREPGRRGSLKPVAAYFIVPAETMEYETTGNKISKWRQRMPNGDFQEHDPGNIVHFYYDRKDGFVFGTPTIVPVVDDIRALRKIEENIELLIYQFLFPLFQYKVGTEAAPAGITETGESEVDVIKREIQFMPTEGGIVTPERHEIKAVGAEGRALRAEGYLDHFKKRVFAGLAISAVDMGEGETANRATADNMSRNLIDSVKDFQQVMEIFVNEHIIAELLLESTFGTDVLDAENRCWIKFKEIDIDQQIKREAHIVDQFNKHAVTWPELRRRMGYQPILVPSPEEVESGTDTPDRYPEWNQTYWKLFRLPEVLAQSIDEPWSPAARAAAKDNSLPMTEKDNEESSKAQQEHEVNIEKEKAKARQAAKPAPKKKDNYLAEVYLATRREVVSRVSADPFIDKDWVASLIRTQMATSISRLIADQMLAFYRGYLSTAPTMTIQYTEIAASARSTFQRRAERYINKLTEDVVRTLQRNMADISDPSQAAVQARAVFDALKYRTDFIEDVEVRKAHSYGQIEGNRLLGLEIATSMATGENPCLECISRQERPFEIEFATIDDVPPHHANCNCTLVSSVSDVGLQDVAPSKRYPDNPTEPDAQDPSGVIPDGEFSECPKCGRTASRTKNTPDIYSCKACSHTFRRIQSNDEEPQDLEDGSKLERCVLNLKTSLRKSHPDWDEKKIKSVAIATCTKQQKGN